MPDNERSGEYVGITSIECRGANPIDQLKTPIAVSINLKANGTRNIGCLYLRAFESSRDHNQSLYICTARQNPEEAKGLNLAVHQLIDNMDTIQNMSWSESLKQWNDFKKATVAITPLCYHKDVM